MKLKLKRDGEIIEVDKVTVLIDETEFRISVTKQGELIINKWAMDEGAICVQPRAVNEIFVK